MRPLDPKRAKASQIAWETLVRRFKGEKTDKYDDQIAKNIYGVIIYPSILLWLFYFWITNLVKEHSFFILVPLGFSALWITHKLSIIVQKSKLKKNEKRK